MSRPGLEPSLDRQFQAHHRLETALLALSQEHINIQQDTKTLEMQYHEKCQEVEELKKKSQADEAELNDLLECLGIEEQKVEKLSRRLRELGEDVDKLLQTENDE
ncbi:hypothetical protein CQW23_04944 [Capsicum baccatum]|uniref:Uso1/p115-like vesicle tethering protein C-terminal domain-containing protein n=1 Tax=Capsicum baccatum TaxID=33114 RepID=A0A2G2XG41_CAPBA|nr:hypothetical protein CQW23_04944 [Capsicum baccatum]